MVKFGYPGEFNNVCHDRNEVVRLGTTEANRNYPGGEGSRSITTSDCIATANFPYEIWSGMLNLEQPAGGRNDGPLAANSAAWEVLDAVRYYDPAKSNKISYSSERLGVSFDSPDSPYKGLHRGQYLNSHRIYNAGGPEYWYTDVFGGNPRTAPFPGSIRQRVSSVDADLVNKIRFQPRVVQRIFDDGNATVHAPN
jgi:hypothetical protein